MRFKSFNNNNFSSVIRSLACICSLFLVPLYSISQVKKDDEKSFETQFLYFKNSELKKYQNFIDKNDSLFIDFLKKAWGNEKLTKNEFLSTVKPVFQPVVNRDSLITSIEVIEKLEVIVKDSSNFNTIPSNKTPELNFESFENNNLKSINKTFYFFSEKEFITQWQGSLPRLSHVNPKSITDFYSAVAKNRDSWQSILLHLNKLNEKYRLNDWGFYQLVKAASTAVFIDHNEQKLFTWFLLLKSGFITKIGYDENDIYVMLATRNKLYSTPYFIESGLIYFVLDVEKKNFQNIQTHQMNYPVNTRNFSFELKHYPIFEGQILTKRLFYKSEELLLEFSKSKIDFLASYPQCDLNIYFQSGLTSKSVAVLDGLFYPLIKGKNNREIIDLLLNFCHTALTYATDQDQFGKEKYLFAEESLFYPQNDCEDRTILLASLVKRYTGLPSIALDFPGHVTLAVQLSDNSNGAFITYANQKYYICDPTYLNARTGMISDEYKTMKAKILTY
jgi:hypothetical protein